MSEGREGHELVERRLLDVGGGALVLAEEGGGYRGRQDGYAWVKLALEGQLG